MVTRNLGSRSSSLIRDYFEVFRVTCIDNKGDGDQKPPARAGFPQDDAEVRLTPSLATRGLRVGFHRARRGRRLINLEPCEAS